MTASDETKTKLRELRNRLAFELPRARVRPSTPPELTARLQASLDAVSGAYAMPAASTASAAEAIEEAMAQPGPHAEELGGSGGRFFVSSAFRVRATEPSA